MDTTYNFDWSGLEDALADAEVSTTTSMEAPEGLVGMILGMGAFLWILLMVVAILMIVSFWKLFTKAGKPGWAAIIPIYNLWVLFEIAGLPGWTALLMLIPVVGGLAIFVLNILAAIRIAPKFGKETIFAIGLILLPVVFYPMLAFGKAEFKDDTTTKTESTVE